MELISLPLVLLLISNIHSQRTEDITPTLTVQPQTSVFIGDTVTLICEVHQSTEWEFIFITPSKTESTEPTGTKTITSVQVSDGGDYKCIARRKENQSVYTQYSKPITVTVKDVTPTLTVQPQTSVFIGDSVTLICEVHQSTGWEFIFTTPLTKTESTETTGTKTITSVRVSDGGEYKCRARRGNPLVYTQYSKPITVTVQERPTPQVSVWPADHVFRGETVNLRCVINGGGVSSWQYSWYKDSIIQQNKLQSYTIRSVTESDAGKYTCRRKETSGSRYSHISNEVTLTVSATGSSSLGLIIGLCLGLSVMFLIFFLVLLWCYKNKKLSQSPSAFSPQQNISQTSDRKQTEDGYNHLHTGEAHLYDSINTTDSKDTSSDNVNESADLTYADIELKPKKEMKKKKEKKGNNSEEGDIVYSKLKKAGDQDVASGSVDVTYAQIKRSEEKKTPMH